MPEMLYRTARNPAHPGSWAATSKYFGSVKFVDTRRRDPYRCTTVMASCCVAHVSDADALRRRTTVEQVGRIKTQRRSAPNAGASRKESSTKNAHWYRQVVQRRKGF